MHPCHCSTVRFARHGETQLRRVFVYRDSLIMDTVFAETGPSDDVAWKLVCAYATGVSQFLCGVDFIDLLFGDNSCAQVGLAQVGFAQVCPAQIGVKQVGPAQIGLTQVGSV